MRTDALLSPVELAGSAVAREPSPCSFSVVINTDGRLEYLKRTLAGLRYQTHSDFEVCVVAGPTPDGTREYLASLDGQVKLAHCPERVLSKSRNIGIAMAAGDVVCFIDDDAVPEPEWLEQLAPCFTEDDVGAAGGFVYDHTGVSFQARYVIADRLGYATDCDAPAPHLNFAFSHSYPHLLGTNCAFRRSALLETGGFDEEYEYFLDETDVCARINDAGYRIEQVKGAYVHHKYAPSHLRDAERTVRNWYPLIKNRLYFGLRNAALHHSSREIEEAVMGDVRGWAASVAEAHARGVYTQAEVTRFGEEVARALADARSRAKEPQRLLSGKTRREHHRPFKRYSTLRPSDERMTICLVTQDYPPGQNGGIARNMFHLGRALAAQGHHVHVLTKSRGSSTVDFEHGVWVHRVAIRHHRAPAHSPIAPLEVPSHIWNYSASMLEETAAIDAKRKVDVVYCPLWDCEPLGFILEKRYPTIVALQTTMRFWLESQPLKRADVEWMREYGEPILAMEDLILEHAPLMHANSQAIVDDIRRSYAADLPEDRLFYSPHGMDDWAEEVEPVCSSGKQVKLLFVGRLESRKGIDTLLAAVPDTLAAHPDVVLDIVGDDTVPRPDGTTYKDEFLSRSLPTSVRKRIRFHGRVEEDELRQFYANCDIFIAPSRYESFGLVFLEAMVFSKPVIACEAGGATEVISDGETGILVPPAQPFELARAIHTLIVDRSLRTAMGKAGRRRFEAKFTEAKMAQDFIAAAKRLIQHG